MAMDDQSVGTTLDYLGRSQPLASQKLALTGGGTGGGISAPVTPPVGPTGGVGGDAGVGPGGGKGGGFNPLALTGTALSLAKRLFGAAAPGDVTRGDVGGEGTPQTANQSLSDQLRSGGFSPDQIDQVMASLQNTGISESALAEVLMGGSVPLGDAAGGAVAGADAAGIGLADALPYVGAVLPAISSFAQGGPKDTKEWANLGVDTAAAAAAPFTFGASEAASGIARGIEDIMAGKPAWQTILDFGGLGMLSGFLDKPGGYGGKRERAWSETGADLSGLNQALQSSAQQYATSRDPATALQGLQTKFGDRNPVRSWLALPNDLAASITGQPASKNYGDRSQVEWSMLDPAGFGKLLDAFRADPSILSGSIRGSGDVAYLPQAQAEQVAAQAAQESQAYLTAILQLGQAPPAGPSAPPPTTPPPPSDGPVPSPLMSGGPSNALGFADQLLKSA